MSVGDRYVRLYERLGAVGGYVLIVLACLPITLPLAGIAHIIAVLVALHVAASAGTRGGRLVARWRTQGVVLTAPVRLPGEALTLAAGRMDPQELVRALARLPAPARERWLGLAGELPHRCGTTVRAEVERQGAPAGDAGLRELDALAGRLEWSTRRPAMRVLAFAPTLVWLVITAIALADWPAPGESLLFGLATLFCVVGLAGMAVYALVDERRGSVAAGTSATADW